MSNTYLTSFKIDDKECADLTNLNIANVQEEYDEETGKTKLLNPARINTNKDSVIQIIVKPEHRTKSLYKVLTVRSGDNNAPKVLQLYHNDFTNDFGSDFERDGRLTVDTSTLPINEMYSIEFQLFRDDPEDPMAPSLEFVFYYLEVFLSADSETEPAPEPEPEPTIQNLESELFIKIAGKWFRLVDKID